MRSPSFVSGTTVWAATLCAGVEISPFDDARDPRAGDACPQRLPPRRAPGASQLRPCAPQLRSGLKLSLDPARRFGPAGDMRRAVHPPAWPRQYIVSMRSRRGLGREKSQFVATYCLHAFKYS